MLAVDASTRIPTPVCGIDKVSYMQAVLKRAQEERLAFSWLSTGQVCQMHSAAYAAMGFAGRNK